MENRGSTPYVYILGYGRSGSTVIEMYFGDYVGARCLGEVSNFLRKPLSRDVLCSCGLSVCDCEQWLKLFRSNSASTKEVTKHLLPNALTQNQLLVDSSKGTIGSVLHVFRVLKCAKNIVFILPLRSPQGIILSRAKGNNAALRRGRQGRKAMHLLRLVPSYYLAMTFSILCVWISRKKYVLVDMESRPKASLRRVDFFLHKEFDLCRARIDDELDAQHLCEGNRVNLTGKKIEITDLSMPVLSRWPDKLAACLMKPLWLFCRRFLKGNL